MITAVDTNIFLDILIPDSPHGETSEKLLINSLEAGSVIISEAVYAELSAHFSTKEQIDRFLGDTNISLCSSSADALYMAGRAWRQYLSRRTNAAFCPSCGITQEFRCTECGAALFPRQYLVADFIIGAHASVHADRLLTRDRGYYRTYFPGLQLTEIYK